MTAPGQESDGMPPDVVSPPTWRAIGASTGGASHVARGLPNQDRHATSVMGCTLGMVVADGAGSAALGHVGAAVAVETAIGYMKSMVRGRDAPKLDPDGVEEGLHNLLTETVAAVEQKAERCRVKTKELSATLIAVLATPDFAASLHIGDGAVVVGTGDGEIVTLSEPERNEYVNVTTFLTSAGASESARMQVLAQPIAHIAAFTDGLQRLLLKMPECTPATRAFNSLFSFICEEDDCVVAEAALEQLLLDEDVRRRTDDDLTLVLSSLCW